MKHWILAARPKTLPAAVIPVVLGCGLALRVESQWDWILATLTLGSALCIQIATNFFNDLVDFRKGADTSARLGPTRMAADGRITPRSLTLAALLALAVAIVLAIPLLQLRGWPILLIGLPSLYLSFGYTGGPLPLAYRGLGEVFVLLFFGLIAVPGTYFVQTGEWTVSSLVLGFQTGCLSTVLIAINNLRDVDEDRKSGKRTLAVRWGRNFAREEITILVGLGLLGGVYWIVLTDYPWAGVLPLSLFLAAGPLLVRIRKTEPGRHFNGYLAASAMILMGFGLLFSGGLFL